MSDAVLLRALDEVDRVTSVAGHAAAVSASQLTDSHLIDAAGSASQLPDSQLIDAAGDAERAESGGNAERVVERAERVAGESAALDPIGASTTLPTAPAITISTAKEAARSPALKAFAYIPPTQKLAAEYAFTNSGYPPYYRQSAINEASPTAQGIDVLASQTIQAGGGIKRVHAKLILGNNKPPKLFIQSPLANGCSSNADAAIDEHHYPPASNANAAPSEHRTPAKRGRPSKRNAIDQPR
ncbi:MAG: hypothetical protein FD143_3604 [Ignavibacteria bacterium]|nr:MAG: hypothetical protein FD143_3604 [Ignavibacteria bacterium]